MPSRRARGGATPRPAVGIRRHGAGWQAYVRVGGRLYTRTFPRDTPLSVLQHWREETARRGGGRPGSLAADVAHYLRLVATMPTWRQRAQHLQCWIEALGPDTPRATITAAQITAVLQRWRQAGLAPATCNKRRTALRHLFRVLDGRSRPNPVAETPKFPEPEPLPRGQPYADLLARLRRLPPSAVRARLLVLLTTGLRPCELESVQPEDVTLGREPSVLVRTRKGGPPRLVPLNPDAIAAWDEFRHWRAWGPFPRVSAARALHRVAPGTRLYDLRHSFGTAPGPRRRPAGCDRRPHGPSQPRDGRPVRQGLGPRGRPRRRRADGQRPVAGLIRQARKLPARLPASRNVASPTGFEPVFRP